MHSPTWLRARYSLFALAALLAAASAPAQTTVPLAAFHSPSRGDYFTTSDPNWTCKLSGCGTAIGDYTLVGMQGHVYNPALTRPSGTVPLWHWWSPVRMDNFITSNPAWDPALGTFRAEGGANYSYVRLVGYLPTGGSYPALNLLSFWNPAAGDNAALTAGATTMRSAVPRDYASYRTEGQLLPPPSTSFNACRSGGGISRVNTWTAHANVLDHWPGSAGYLGGDTVQFTAPAQSYVIDLWGNTKSIRGDGSFAPPSGWPAAGRPRYALLARVASGRAFVADQGWFEANQWFRALGTSGSLGGGCVYYQGSHSDLQTMFNDDNIGDNSGGASLTMLQWYF